MVCQVCVCIRTVQYSMEPLPDHVRIMLDRVAKDKENGFKHPRYDVQAAAEQGDNFCGQLLRVIIHETGDSSKEILSLIVKCTPKDANRRQLLSSKLMFEKEIFVYDELLPSFTQLLKRKGILSDQEAFPSTPRCYSTRTSEDGAETTIILKDMSASGYAMGDRFGGADEHQCRLVLRELARFHAASFMLEEEDPELFKRFVASTEKHKTSPEWLQGLLKLATQARPMIADRFPEGTLERAKFEEYVRNYLQIMRDVSIPDNNLSVICHGDPWLNNILLKYDKDSSVPSKVCLIDFQMVRHCSPVIDLAYFLFSSTTKTVRDKCFKQLLVEYHSSLSTFLKTFSCSKVVTWKDMEDQYRKYMKYGLGLAITALPIMMSKQGDIKGVNDDSSDAISIESVFDGVAALYNPERDTRVSDVLQDLVEYGYV